MKRPQKEEKEKEKEEQELELEVDELSRMTDEGGIAPPSPLTSSEITSDQARGASTEGDAADDAAAAEAEAEAEERAPMASSLR